MLITEPGPQASIFIHVVFSPHCVSITEWQGLVEIRISADVRYSQAPCTLTGVRSSREPG
jgi:hypothetical protein